jgi:hypothetical protein
LAGRIPARLTAAEGRKFGLVVGAAFLVFGGLMWRRGHLPPAYVAAGLGGLLFLAGLTAPQRLGPVYRAWMALARAISKVTTPIVMGAIWFLVITPAGLLVRLFGHRPLSHPRDATTFWHTRPAGERRSVMDHQF